MYTFRLSIRKFLLVFILIVSPLLATCQWNWMNPLPQGNDLKDIRFLDPSTGYAVGDGGTILKTLDGGFTWNRLVSGTIYDLTSVFFVNSNVGYVTGVSFVLKTIDGGITWTMCTQSFLPDLAKVWFTDENTGYVCASWAEMFKTTDGGITWFQIPTIPGDDYWSICFTDASTCYVGGSFGIYKSTNGGNSWTTLYYNSASIGIMGLFFPNLNTGYATGINGLILKRFFFTLELSIYNILKM